MSLSGSPLERLSTSERDVLQHLVARFDAAWRLGPRPRLEDYLLQQPDQRLALLLELVQTDLAHRARIGEPARVEDYLARFPELSGLLQDVLSFPALTGRPAGQATAVAITLPPAEAGDAPATLPPLADADPQVTLPEGSSPARAGTPAVPGYEVLGELGRGGMGVVYKARHLRLNRLVALKMVLAGGHSGAEERIRFLAEAEAVAALQHPNVVQVFEFGEHDGLPYVALEYVNGGSLNVRLRDGLPVPKEAAWLVEQLARGMAAAHGQGIIHRDLKPHNVLLAISPLSSRGREAGGEEPLSPLSRYSGRGVGGEGSSAPLAPRGREGVGEGEDHAPLSRCTPKITDFGLAKRVEGGGLTQTGAVMGTPSYVAPEQAEGKKDVGPAVDVYALGAILYECLTGRPPFRGSTPLDTLRQVVLEEPASVRQLQPSCPRDLETICHKCLQKDRTRRYSGALELAEDLQRFQAGMPVQARPVSRLERSWRWCRRNPVVASLTAAVLLVLVLGTWISLFFAIRAVASLATATLANKDKDTALLRQQEETRKANEATEKALRQLQTAVYVRQLAEASECYCTFKLKRAEDILFNCDEELLGWEWEHLIWLCRDKHPTLRGHHKAVYSVAISPDGKRIVSASEDKTVKIWDAQTGQELHTLKGHSASVYSVVFSPDGKRIASASKDQTVKVWDAQTGQELHTLKGHSEAVWSVAFSPNGKRIASGSEDKTVKIWDAQTGQELHTLKGHSEAVWSVAFSPDGKRIASASEDKTVKIWDAQTGQELHTLKGHSEAVWSVAFSPDGKRIASASEDKTVKIWDAQTAAGKKFRLLPDPPIIFTTR